METISEIGPETLDAWGARIATITADVNTSAGGGLIERSIGGLLRVVREQLKLEVVFIGEFVNEQRVFRHVSASSDDPIVNPGDSHPIDESICQRIIDGRMPALVSDVGSLRGSYGLPAYFEAMGGHIGVPVRFSDGRLYGMLCGFSFEPCPHLDERDLRRLEMAANATARLLAQAEGLDVDLPND